MSHVRVEPLWAVKCNQAAEVTAMPYFDRGSEVLMIEDVISTPELLGSWVSRRIGEGCKCSIVDSPFVARVSRNGLSFDATIGVGSIVCSGCRGAGDVVLEEPAWGSGRVIEGGVCLFHGECSELRAGLSLLGYRVVEAGLEEWFERVSRRGERGVAVLGEWSPRLEVEPLGPSICGRLETPNPLHPVGALGKPGLEGCVEEPYWLSGPQARLVDEVLRVSGRPVVARLGGLGEGLILGYTPRRASRYPRLAAWLGLLYTCSSERD